MNLLYLNIFFFYYVEVGGLIGVSVGGDVGYFMFKFSVGGGFLEGLGGCGRYGMVLVW